MTGWFFPLKVSPQEMVQEIHQVLMDREDTCHRTCFSLQLDGNVLDNFAELKTIEGLQEGSLLKVVEGKFPQALGGNGEGFHREWFWPPGKPFPVAPFGDLCAKGVSNHVTLFSFLPFCSSEPYTVREARIHVRHIRDLLKSLDPSDAFNGVDCNSLSFLSVFTEGDLGGTGQKGLSGVAGVFIPLTPGFVKAPHNDQLSHIIQECRETLGALLHSSSSNCWRRECCISQH